MKSKTIIILSILFLSILLNGNVFAQSTNEEEVNTESKTLSIQKLVEEKTPPFIKKIIEKITNVTEKFRIDTAEYLTKKRDEIRQDLEDISKETNVLNSTEDAESSESPVIKPFAEVENSIFIKPIKYINLIFFTSSSVIFQNKTIFYLTSFLIIFFFFRLLMKD